MTVQDLQDALLDQLATAVPGTTHSRAIEALLEVLDVHHLIVGEAMLKAQSAHQ